ncbi:MAG TPA: hypothetical protein VGH20_19710 [Myxococcales bacterium]|jgi:hypothetical protein
MPRQPYRKINPGAHYYINADCLKDRPAMAALIARCLAGWSLVDLEMASVLAAMLGPTSEAGVAVYLSLQNARAKRDALISAAKVVLSGPEFRVVNAMVKKLQSLAKERHDLAHGVFGVLSDYQDRLLWCSSAHFARWMTNANKTAWRLEFDPDPHAPLLEKLCVYRDADLESLRDEFSEAFHLATQLHQYVAPIPNVSKQPIFDSISSHRMIREALQQRDGLRESGDECLE